MILPTRTLRLAIRAAYAGPDLSALGPPYTIGGKLPDSWNLAWVMLGLALLEIKPLTVLALNEWLTDRQFPTWPLPYYRAVIARYTNRFTMRPQTITEEMKNNPINYYREEECYMLWDARQSFAAAATNEPIYLRFPFDTWLLRSL